MAPKRSMTQFKIAVLEFIEDYYIKNLFSPSLREIIEGVGHGSTSSVSYCLDSLTTDGFLTEGIEGQARTRIPTFKPRHAEPQVPDYDY